MWTSQNSLKILSRAQSLKIQWILQPEWLEMIPDSSHWFKMISDFSVSVGMSIKNTEVILGRLYYIGNLWFSSGVYSFCISVSVDSWNEISPHRYSIISGDFVLLTHKCNIVLTNHKQNLLTFLSFLILKWV